MITSANNELTASAVDYDLHGIVGIRLLNASDSDAAAVDRQLGPLRAPLRRSPDLTIRFVERFSATSNVRYIGLDDAGFTDDAFLVFRSRHKSCVRVQIPFDRIGDQCEIVCESGLPAIPLLIPVVNLTALAKNVLPLHASAFTYGGKGVITTGWSKGGKTETLLAFMAQGARYVGDEWVYVRDDGREMYGVPEPVTLWDWHLDEMPDLRALVPRWDRTRLRTVQWIIRALNQATSGNRVRTRAARQLARILPLLKRQQFVHLPPERVFGDRFGESAASLDKILFVASHDSPELSVTRLPPGEIADRMVFSLQEERSLFLSYYMKFRFAFPSLRNELIESAELIQRTLLHRALAEKDAYAVYHPYPVPIASLFDAVSPVI